VRKRTPAEQEAQEKVARILLVNDEADLVEICGMVLEEVGHQVEGSIEGTRAPELARKRIPDLVILDLRLKDTTGEEVMQALRAQPETRKTPVLIISALADGGAVARQYGAAGFLAKPFTAEALTDAVDRLVPRPS
jgi:CheY-like chemotaxis protein